MNCGSAFSLRLALAPVVIRRPIARERLNRRELHALRGVRDGFPFGPPCRLDAPAQFGQLRLRNIDTKRTNRGLVSRLLAASFGNMAGVMLTPSRGHETRRATSDLSDEGIDDTFVSFVHFTAGLHATE